MITENSYIEKLVEAIQATMPEFLRASDLVSLHLYKTRADVSVSVKRGLVPPFIRFTQRKILFPKAALCEWLRKKASQDFVKVEEQAHDPIAV